MKTSDQVSIGVVIRTKDRPIFITRAIATVQAQTHQSWHIVIVNDGGDADVLKQAIAAQLKLPGMQGKLTLLDLSPGVGRSAAFNRGVEALSTELVACLDDDDTWAPEFMAAMAEFYLETSANVDDLGGVAAQVTALKEDFFDTEQGQEVRVIGEDSLPPAFRRGEFFLNPLAYACYRQDIYPVQWVMRRDAVLATGGFPEHFDVMEDRAFMNLFLARYRLAILDRPLCFHHRRVQRADDRGRNVLLNTLDNPSYDWRLFADLARPGIDLGQSAASASVFRSIAADLLSELNYETSAIWQKVDGEMATQNARLDRDKAELLGLCSALMEELVNLNARFDHYRAAPLDGVSGKLEDDLRQNPCPSRAPGPDIPVALCAFDLWSMIPADGLAQYLQPGQRFAGQLELSTHAPEAGLLLHASPDQSSLEIQIPATNDWAAIELALDGLASEGGGLRVHLQLSAGDGYLFETALVNHGQGEEARYQVSDFQIHACSRNNGCLVTREISAEWIAAAKMPKFSIILPRQAQNFRFICQNLMVERVQAI